MSSPTNEFCDELENFIDAFQNIFPNNKNIDIIKNKMSLLRKSNPKLMVQTYLHMFTPYIDSIVHKNDSFITEYKPLNNGDLKDEIFKLWSELSDNNKETSWIYLQRLLYLASKV